MSREEAREPTKGDGYTVASLDGLGEGYGFRKIRRDMGVREFGINAIVLPPGYETGRHQHEEQQELYFVHRGAVEISLDGSTYRLGEGGIARVDPDTVRSIRNVGDGDAVYVIVGAKGGYVGHDGKLPEGEESPRGPGFSGPPGAGPPLPGESA